jgi:hypothetical protein
MKAWRMILFAVAILVTTQLQARLGETVEECISRYGKPLNLSKAPSNLIFIQKDDLFVCCSFIYGKCNRISISRNSGDFSEAEIKMLLELNGGSGEWTASTSARNRSIKSWLGVAGRRAMWLGTMLIISFPILPESVEPVIDDTKARSV